MQFPFLFPFSTRFSFLQSTSFGYARLILKWQSQNRAQDTSRRDDTFGFLGRLQRQKVRISRKHILESAFKVFELYGSSSSILEVEYFDEVGTGLGPTLEFYSMVSKEFARRDLKIWRDADSTYPGAYVHHPTGLFPAPVGLVDANSDAGEKRIYVFKIIGQFVAKAMLDSRIIDMSFNKIFLRLVLGEEVQLSIANLRVSPAYLIILCHLTYTIFHVSVSILLLQTLCQSFRVLLTLLRVVIRYVHNPKNCCRLMFVIQDNNEHISVEDLMLDFTLPGYDIELRVCKLSSSTKTVILTWVSA